MATPARLTPDTADGGWWHPTVRFASFRVTTDPADVRRYGSVHDCERCRAGVEVALHQLAAHPTDELVIGHLVWTNQPANPNESVEERRLREAAALVCEQASRERVQ